MVMASKDIILFAANPTPAGGNVDHAVNRGAFNNRPISRDQLTTKGISVVAVLRAAEGKMWQEQNARPPGVVGPVSSQ